jgi:signal transduction histidine kinase
VDRGGPAFYRGDAVRGQRLERAGRVPNVETPAPTTTKHPQPAGRPEQRHRLTALVATSSGWLLSVPSGRAVAPAPRRLRRETGILGRGNLLDRLRYPAGVAALAGLYYGSARLGYELEFAGPVAAIVWLPAGVGIAFLYLGGLRFWPGVLAGDLLANNYHALPVETALLQTCGNMAEVLLATMLLRRLVPRESPLASVRGVGCLVVSLVGGTIVSATVGALSLLLPRSDVSAGELPDVWRTWWLGDLSGALVVVPLALAWWPPVVRREEVRWKEATLLLVAILGLGELALRSENPIAYLCYPALIWAALRFGARGATLALTIVVGLAVWNTTHYVGPFAFESVTRSVLTTQLFIAAAALPTLYLVAVVSERERFADGLAASRARLATAADNERRRLERNLHDGAQQRLSVLTYRLREARLLAADDPARAATLYADAEAQLDVAIEELRELAHGIHPPVLTDFGLARAIEELAARSPVPVELVELPSERLDVATEATGYYVVAEAVTNAQRHAKASSIRVRAAVADGTLSVDVVDNGVGGAAEALGSGLRGLRDRVDAAGGTFVVKTVAGRGTRVSAVVPAPAGSAAAG